MMYACHASALEFGRERRWNRSTPAPAFSHIACDGLKDGGQG
ncbi:hypothetical protein ACFOGG_13880 [Brenneria rubrifaciens]